jgi:hypothetical protein
VLYLAAATREARERSLPVNKGTALPLELITKIIDKLSAISDQPSVISDL